MDSFLLKIVKSLGKEESQFKNLVFILPNRRAGVYLKKHLIAETQETSFFPEIITFDNFVERISNILKTPSLELLVDFYKIYKQNTAFDRVESFELFSNWARTVLDDFNEIDANLVDPNAIFSSLKEINELHNWNPDTTLTQNYREFFKNLEKYYKEFYKFLLEEKKAYQGLLFRQAVELIHSFIENTDKKYVFAGFNQLKTSESQIIQELLAAEKARIYWNISKEMLHGNKPTGKFIRSYIEDWSYYKTNKFNWISDEEINENNIEIVGVPKSVGMMKYAGEILSNLKSSEGVALVLGDQNLLPITLNSIPRHIEQINITMGVPLKNYPFSNLVDSVLQLHLKADSKVDGNYYYKYVLQILQHPILQHQFSNLKGFVSHLVKENRIHYNYDTIKQAAEGFTVPDFDALLHVFKPLSNEFLNELLTRINVLIEVQKTKGSAIEKEVLYRHYQLNQQMMSLFEEHKETLNLPEGTEGIKSLYTIYKKIVFSENFSFIGEPLQGLQIMGFLETQALNFNQLIITSLNEGVLPKGKKVNSFIPFDVRKHYKLHTYQEENAIESYHFYRLLSAANKITLLYNSETDTFGGGEKSQFLTQLLWTFPKIKQKIVSVNTKNKNIAPQSSSKTAAVLETLKEIAKHGFSPSSLSTYVYCPITFYQKYVLGIEELNEVEETVADNTLGTVIHETLEKLYKPLEGKLLSQESLKALLPRIPGQVQIEFKNAYKSGQYAQGKNKLIYEVIVNFVERFIREEIREVKRGKSIRIISLEKDLSTDIVFPRFEFPIKIKGKVDRIDEVDGVIRIVDFKSGKVDSSQLRMNDFSKMIADYKYSKGLQVLLYAYMYSQQKEYNVETGLQAGIISFKNFNAGFIPVNFAAPYTKNDHSITGNRLNEFLTGVEALLIEIFDVNIPFLEKQ